MRTQRNTISARTIKFSLPTITFTLPAISQEIKNLPADIFEFIGSSLTNIFSRRSANVNPVSSWGRLPRPRKRLILTLALVLLVATIGTILVRRGFSNNSRVAGQSVDSIEVNREFEFPLKDANGEATDIKLKLVITKVDRSKTIVIKGQNATSVAGRTFLIVNLKLENPTKTSLSMKTRDFIRLLPEGTNDRLAPDIHNDPAEVQAISTKITRVGFPVDESIRNFKLFVGEINGEKQEIELKF